MPGAKLDFTVLFSVPEGTKLKDLVFTLRTISNTDKGSDARVSLGNETDKSDWKYSQSL